MLVTILLFIGRHATRFMFFGVLAGLALPALAEFLKPAFVPLLLIPLTLALMRLDWQAFRAYSLRPGLILTLLIFLQVICPLLMLALLAPLHLPEALTAAVVLMAAAPPIISAAAIALILGLDVALAAIVVVLATALVPLTLPPLALLLLNITIEMSLVEFMGRLALLVGLAFGVALVLRRVVAASWLARNAKMLDGISVLNLVLFSITIMAGVTDKIRSDPAYVVLSILIAFIANLLLQGIGYGLGRLLFRLPPVAAVTLGLLTGNCNMGLVMVALGDRAEFDMIVFFAMGQLPMYMLPGLLHPLYRRLARTGE